jgi:hypothetical protein
MLSWHGCDSIARTSCGSKQPQTFSVRHSCLPYRVEIYNQYIFNWITLWVKSCNDLTLWQGQTHTSSIHRSCSRVHILDDAIQCHLTGSFSGELSLAIADHRSQIFSLHMSHYKNIADFVQIKSNMFENIRTSKTGSEPSDCVSDPPTLNKRSWWPRTQSRQGHWDFVSDLKNLSETAKIGAKNHSVDPA